MGEKDEIEIPSVFDPVADGKLYFSIMNLLF